MKSMVVGGWRGNVHRVKNAHVFVGRGRVCVGSLHTATRGTVSPGKVGGRGGPVAPAKARCRTNASSAGK